LDSDNFGVISSGGETKIIINYSNVNTNRIVFNTATTEFADMEVVCFSAKLLKEILNANSGLDGMLEVSSKGLARVTFENENYSAAYYLVKLTVS
jgi:ribosome-associated protein YbcJ (S4-like RNA binding protein)